jgi:hypothetical protein
MSDKKIASRYLAVVKIQVYHTDLPHLTSFGKNIAKKLLHKLSELLAVPTSSDAEINDLCDKIDHLVNPVVDDEKSNTK